MIRNLEHRKRYINYDNLRVGSVVRLHPKDHYHPVNDDFFTLSREYDDLYPYTRKLNIHSHMLECTRETMIVVPVIKYTGDYQNVFGADNGYYWNYSDIQEVIKY